MLIALPTMLALGVVIGLLRPRSSAPATPPPAPAAPRPAPAMPAFDHAAQAGDWRLVADAYRGRPGWERSAVLADDLAGYHASEARRG